MKENTQTTKTLSATPTEQKGLVAPIAPPMLTTPELTTGVVSPHQLPGAGIVAPQAPPQLPRIVPPDPKP